MGLVGAGLAAMGVWSCSPPELPTVPKKETAPKASEPQCADPKAQSRPLVVDWEAAERADIETRARRGVVVARVEECKLSVLSRCSVREAKYDYFGLTPKQDKLVMRDASELYANVPVSAASLEGKLASSGTLEVAMLIVGQYDSPAQVPTAEELEGDCAGATHVVTALTVGAYEFSAGAASEASASASILGAGAGAKKASSREMLSQDGDGSRCAEATAEDTQPPFGCGAVLRIEVVPLGTERRAEPTCASGTEWDGSQCVAVLADSSCAPGQIADKVKGCIDKKPDVVAAERVRAPETQRGAVALKTECTDAESCETLCEANDVKGCLGLGAHLRSNLRPGTATEEGQQAADAFQKACDGSAFTACTALGEMHYQALGVSRDTTTALELFRKACEGGDTPGCNDAGIVLLDRKDYPAATPYFEKACRTPSGLGCMQLGVMARDGLGRPVDKAQAKTYFEKACAGVVKQACKLVSSL